MPRFVRYTPEQAAAICEIEHFVTEYWYDLDINGLVHVRDFWFDDGYFKSGTAVDLRGIDAIAQFYKERRQLVLEGPGGTRTSRHISTNTRFTFHGPDEVSFITTDINFSGAGVPPLAGSSPTMVADAYMTVGRDPTGQWRLREFIADIIFVGDDPFQNKRLMGSEKPI